MTKIYCGYRDCENNDEGSCISGAVKITPEDCCLNYHPLEDAIAKGKEAAGDSLLWDREYFEDDPLDDDIIY